MHIKKQRLLTPGPTPLLPRALHAMMASDVHHRTQDFQRIYRQVLADLKVVFGTTNDVLPLVSSGSGAMEAAVSNLFRRGDKVIVCSAGKFGERWVAMTKAFGLDPVVLEAPYGSVVSPERVEEALKAHPETRGVFVQASETSTGAAHDIQNMAAAVRNSEAIFVIDAITGLGTMPLDIDGWGLDVVIGGSQKAFMIPPGLAFLSISKKAWERAASCDLPHFYFDLKKELKSAQNGESSWTPAVSLIISLGEALNYIKELGMNKLIENAQLLARATRAAVVRLGLELFSPASPSASVTAVKAPPGMDSGVIVKAFRNDFGMIIANGQGSMKGQIFRIAHLGYFDFADLFAVIGALEIILHTHGYPVEFGKGVAAVQSVLAEAAFPKVTVGA
ncbi:MAG: alanine--glyoxylate aminotransferase family protein [Bryobacteraceae bacterium]|nr:alanine--glyoxylate aminotransferase family protein [Bryobacteraceae bacterium]MDW8377903.1 alanine--glyoxylate aminotransferase family protein [Bryobacterales bacterium]